MSGNLKKARKSWGRLHRILEREGVTARISGAFFKGVVQQVLLFGAETWVVTPSMERALSGFLHGAARRLTGRQARRGRKGTWQYPSLEGAMRETGLTDIGKSIANRQNTVAQYVATRPLLDLCEEARAREGTRVPLRWWNQTGVDWEAAKARGGGGRDRQYHQIGVEHRRGGRPKGGKGRGEQGERFKRGGVEWSECRRVGVSQEE